MTGTELLRGLSFVDERFIDEAENAKLSGGIPWMKILSVAACLCILLAGSWVMGWYNHESIADAPAADMPAADMPAAAAPKEDAQTGNTDNSSAESSLAPGELCHVTYARLLVVNVLEDGSFEAIAEATEDMQVDTPVTVVVDPSKVPGGENIVADAIGVVVGAKIEIYDGAYDTENNTLYIAQWLPIE
jgi:hypothetical protein